MTRYNAEGTIIERKSSISSYIAKEMKAVQFKGEVTGSIAQEKFNSGPAVATCSREDAGEEGETRSIMHG